VEPDQKGIPVLLRQYLRLGGKLLGFNEDASFSHALDGLLLLDLARVEPKTLRRYMGHEGVEKFLAYHYAGRSCARPDSNGEKANPSVS